MNFESWMIDLRKTHSALSWQPQSTKQKLKGHTKKVRNYSTFAKQEIKKAEWRNQIKFLDQCDVIIKGRINQK